MKQRLIDGDKLKEYLKDMVPDGGKKCCRDTIKWMLNDFFPQIIDEQETVTLNAKEDEIETNKRNL